MIGIIGGSGLDDPKIVKDAREVELHTPFGRPSDKITLGKISGVDVALLSRHGKKHTIMPSNVNYRANIWALKELGCTQIIATSACGSLQKEIHPGDFVVPSQFIDKTSKRHTTFYDKDRVCHISMEEPFCSELRTVLAKTMDSLGIKYHSDKTVITIEGPRFSTRAESMMHRSWGADIINMSTVPEVVLAREAGLCYQVIAMATDYDCFMEHNVTWEQIAKVMSENAEKMKKVIVSAVRTAASADCTHCKSAINSALVGEPIRSFDLKSLVRTIPDWPRKGIMFRDITTLLKDPKGYQLLVDELAKRYRDNKPDVVVGIEARGFILGGALAYLLGVGFVPIRKKGKLPGKTVSQEYELEYGKDSIEVHEDSIIRGQKVLVVDDLLATGGTALAAYKLIEKLGGIVVEGCFMIDLPVVGGSKKLKEKGYSTFFLFEF